MSTVFRHADTWFSTGPDVEVSEVASVGVRASLAPSKKTYPHGDFEEENYIGAVRQRPFQEMLLSTVCLHADYAPRSVGVQIRMSRGRMGGIHSGNWAGGVKAHIGVVHEHLLGSTGDNTQSHKHDGNIVFRRNFSLRTSSSWSHFHQSREMQQILETTRAPLATYSDSSFSAVPRFALLYRPHFLRVP